MAVDGLTGLHFLLPLLWRGPIHLCRPEKASCRSEATENGPRSLDDLKEQLPTPQTPICLWTETSVPASAPVNMVVI